MIRGDTVQTATPAHKKKGRSKKHKTAQEECSDFIEKILSERIRIEGAGGKGRYMTVNELIISQLAAAMAANNAAAYRALRKYRDFENQSEGRTVKNIEKKVVTKIVNAETNEIVEVYGEH